jgi:hypothetical protein
MFLARGTEALDVMAQRGYTPLLPVLEAVLFYITNPDLPLDLLGWPPAFDPLVHALTDYLRPLPQIKLLIRISTIGLTLLLAALVFRWGKDLWGTHAGLLALVALTFDPTLLAHGRLATTDVGVTTLGTAALYTAWRWSKTPTWGWALGTGTFVGLTALAKISGPLWGIAVGIVMLSGGMRQRKNLWKPIFQMMTAGLWGLFIFWAGYGFTWGETVALPFAVPAPAYWDSFSYLTHYRSEFFALGQRQQGRWWWYFPLTFVLKNPLPLLIGWGIGAAVLWQRRRANVRFFILQIFSFLYVSIAMSTGMNIGYRHLLPIHPFINLLIGHLAHAYSHFTLPTLNRRRPMHFIFFALLLWYILGTLTTVPHELAYFNELIGGPENAYRYLVDSNLDWGETTEYLTAYLTTHPETSPDPPGRKFRPDPGRYIVRASYLQGVGIEDPYAYAWFRKWEPQTVLHNNLLIYDVPPFTTHWIAQCNTPAPPLDAEALHTGLGESVSRLTNFDCTQTWLYPAGGHTSGLYVLQRNLMQESQSCLPGLLPCPLTPEDSFITRHIASGRLSFDHDRQDELPPFVLYELSTSPSLPSSTVYIVSANQTPWALSEINPSATPVTMEGPLHYLGARSYQDTDGLTVETWWRVSDAPITRLFSIMAHILTPQGKVLSTLDGLGVDPTTLATDDIFVQRHRLTAPLIDTEIWLRTGAYWLDTMERWNVQCDKNAENGVLLEDVTVYSSSSSEE